MSGLSELNRFCGVVNNSWAHWGNWQYIYTLEPHYNAHFGVHSDMSVITEQPYNEGLIHRKYKQWEPCL